MIGFSRGSWVLLHDVALAGVSFALAVWLRLGSGVFDYTAGYVSLGAFLSIIIALPVYLQFRQSRGMWRYVSLRDATIILQSAFVIVVFTYAALFAVQRLEAIPRSLPLIQWLVLVALLIGPRVLYRLLQEGHLPLTNSNGANDAVAETGTPILLVGTGFQAAQFLRATQSQKDSPYHVIGLLDTTSVGQRIHGVQVYGPPSALPEILEKLERKHLVPEMLVLTDPEMPVMQVREWLELAGENGLGLSKMPAALELSAADAPITLKPVAVEDLLGRQQAELDRVAMAELIAGKRILITGAGGSIGGELARQILHFGPSALTLLDSSEYALYQIEQEMLTQGVTSVPVYCMLGDVRDTQRLEQIFTFQQPQIVFHAAAIKHVPVAERDCEEAILTNVFGTQHVAECCLQFGAEAMVLISTDKAVEPSNIMGATKRLAERYFLWLSQQRAVQQGKTQFLAVRFGNVLGSTGSVLPLFRRQLQAGGPLTVTHPEMRRYFMTIGEAVQLVLQAAAIGHQQPNNTRGGIFVLDMGDPVKIEDLAKRVIQLAGMRPGSDVQIVYTGIRPGEKLDEALFYEEEAVKETAHQSILLAVGEQVDVNELAEGLVDLEQACLNRDREHAFGMLQQLVPEYAPFQWPHAA